MKVLKKLFNAWVLMNKGFEKSIVCLITANTNFLYFGDGIEQKQLFLLIDIGFLNITHSQKSFRTIIRTYEEFRCSIGFYNSHASNVLLLCFSPLPNIRHEVFGGKAHLSLIVATVMSQYFSYVEIKILILGTRTQICVLKTHTKTLVRGQREKKK